MDSHTVALPREFGIKLRGGKVHKELSIKAPDLVGKKVSQKQIDLAGYCKYFYSSALVRGVITQSFG
jgi:hypothetical protein